MREKRKTKTENGPFLAPCVLLPLFLSHTSVLFDTSSRDLVLAFQLECFDFSSIFIHALWILFFLCPVPCESANWWQRIGPDISGGSSLCPGGVFVLLWSFIRR
ncbi:hypothetical protein V8C44DRAFT_328575 [Trichoderma aethiopicum]